VQLYQFFPIKNIQQQESLLLLQITLGMPFETTDKNKHLKINQL